MNAFAVQLHVASAPSPLVDRRALSQAWYDALHLAEDSAGRSSRGPSGSRSGTVLLSNARSFRPGKVCSPTFYSRLPWPRKKLEHPSDNGAPSVRPPHERRAPASQLARHIVSKLTRYPHHLRFVIDGERGRVILHVVRGRDGVRMVAFCSDAMRADVEKALAQARFAAAGVSAR